MIHNRGLRANSDHFSGVRIVRILVRVRCSPVRTTNPTALRRGHAERTKNARPTRRRSDLARVPAHQDGVRAPVGTLEVIDFGGYQRATSGRLVAQRAHRCKRARGARLVRETGHRRARNAWRAPPHRRLHRSRTAPCTGTGQRQTGAAQTACRGRERA